MININKFIKTFDDKKYDIIYIDTACKNFSNINDYPDINKYYTDINSHPNVHEIYKKYKNFYKTNSNINANKINTNKITIKKFMDLYYIGYIIE